jgi:hypothetical protein
MFTKLLIKIWLKKMNRTEREKLMKFGSSNNNNNNKLSRFRCRWHQENNVFLAKINKQNVKISFGKRFKLHQYFIERPICCTATQFFPTTPFTF